MPTNAISVDQLKFKANNAWNGLDEVRIVNSGDALYCKENVTTGLLMKDNQLQVVAVSWTNGVPAIGAKKGYISSDGDYHIYNSSTSSDTTSLNTLRESVFQLNMFKADSKLLASGTNLDDITTRGLYGVYMSNATGTRPQTFGFGAMIITKYDEYRITQICAVTDDYSFAVYIRMSKHSAGSTIWSAWKKFTLS